MDENSHLTDQMPASIGRYKVEEVKGYGAMGAVYKAFDPLIKRTLAIKTIRLDIPRQSPQYRSFIERFYQEARISGTLSHPNIVTLFDIAEEGGLPFLAMEYIEGETVGALIEKGHRFKPEQVIALVSQVASALDYAHSKGVIHRDIKPSNLILHDAEKIKVTDFGIAKLMDSEMTQSGTLLGTPSYMSPEQAMGDKLDGRSDIFSLGVCAFEMLSGEQPFPGNNVTSILYKLVHVPPVEPANLEMNGLVPQKWHEVFGKVLAKRPGERYQTAAAFVHDLEYCLGSWFGSIDDTLITGTTGDDTATLPRMPAPQFDATSPTLPSTTAPPPVRVPPARPGAATASSLAAAAPAEDSTTVVMKALPASEEATVVLKAPAAAPPPVPAPAEPADTGTVVFKPAPPSLPTARARPSAPADEAAASTVVLKASAIRPETSDPSTIVMKAPLPAPARSGPEPTVIVNSGGPPTITLQRSPALVPEAAQKVPVPEATEPMPLPAAALEPPATIAARATIAPPPVTAPMPKLAPTSALPEKLPGRPGVSPKMLLAGAAVLFLLALAAVGAVLLRRGQQESAAAVRAPVTLSPAMTLPPASMAPIAVSGSIRVETEPAGAAVTVNGETHGSAPLDLAEVPLGTYEVKVELKGYESQTETLSLTEEAPRGEIKLTLAKAAPTTGLADILSSPIGATVTVDGAKLGLTPLTGVRMKPGTRLVEVAREGYEPWTGSLVVQPGQRSRLDASLRALAKAPPPPPPVNAVDTSRIYANTPAEVDTPARKTGGLSVSYPDSAPRLRSGDSVSVSLAFVVNEYGDVTDMRVVESGGKILDETVQAAVRGWKYAPAMKKGTRVKVRVTFKQTFRAG